MVSEQPVVSERVARAQARVQERRSGQVARLRSLGWLLLVAVAVSAWTSGYPPGPSGRGLLVSLALLWYCAAMVVASAGRREPTDRTRLLLIVLTGVPALALTALEPDGTLNVLPVSGTVMIAFLRLERRPALVVGGLGTLVMAVLLATTVHHPLDTVSAAVLLCVVLGATAQLVRTSRENQERTELLLAELEDAREAETRAAAGAERARIARELHDVLAQSLSALAIQLEGARKLAEREQVAPLLQQVIGRSVELTRSGLDEARQAVGALRGDRLPVLADLGALVERSARDLEIPVGFRVTGEVRRLEPQAEFALYRGVQEALTNAARYARDARTEVLLAYGPELVRLTVANDAPDAAPEGARAEAADVARGGGGNGLRGMRERIERVGGTAAAGPTPTGWLVEMEVPA
ncbi:sensor histidine kinase [Kitasatospora sp. LaBMicrA B282]|uniref:sensor histidine kinase n=1 Tax=Kitasatospora sp. LaBMicrA B282 TaxID=3420949 RepID=UPI003D145CF9